MRNLKRALSMALAAIMVLGLMVVGASATSYEDFTDKDEIVNKEAVNTMVSLGVISGKEDGSYYAPADSLTRAEACTLIARMLGGGKDPVLGSNIKSKFTDTQGHWAETYIAYCANLGIIVGVGDGSFNPDGVLTGTAAAKMVLCALGYKPEFEGIGGANWELATNTLATKVKLYDGLEDLNPSDTISRDDVAQLLYNGVQADEVEYRNLEGDYQGTLYAQPVNGTEVDAEPSTLLYTRFNVVKVEGVVVANDIMDIDGEGTTVEGKSRLTDIYVGGVHRVETLNNNTTRLLSEIYPIAMDNSYLGQRVVLYVQGLKNLAPNAASTKVISEPILSEDNTVAVNTGRMKDADAVRSFLSDNGLSIPANGVAFNANLTNGLVVYTENDTQIFNANNAGDNLDRDFAVTTAGLNARGTEYTFIDHDGDGIVDFIFRKLPRLAKVTVYNEADEELTIAGEGTIDFEDIANEDEVAKDDIVLYYLMNETYYLQVAETVSGKVESYNNDNNSVKMDGVDYFVSTAGFEASSTDLEDYTPNTMDMVGNTYTFYLDASGNVIAWVLGEEAVGNYAMILESKTSDVGTGFATSMVKLLMADGTEGTYNVNLLASANKFIDFLGLPNNATASAKELAMSTWLNGNGGRNRVVTYVIGENGTVTLGDPADVSTVSTVDTPVVGDVDTHAVGTVTRSTASYNFRGALDNNNRAVNNLRVNDSTLFFIRDISGDNDPYCVVKGVSNLPTSVITKSDDTPATVESAAFTNTGTNTNVARAVVVDGVYRGTANYVYVSASYTGTLTINGERVYTYPVVFENGEAGTLNVNRDNVQDGEIYQYTVNSSDVAELTQNATTINNVVSTYAKGSNLTLTNGDGSGNVGSFTIVAGAQLWNVNDTANIYAETLSDNMSMAVALDGDGFVKTVFVRDTNVTEIDRVNLVGGFGLRFTAVLPVHSGFRAELDTTPLAGLIGANEQVTYSVTYNNKPTQTGLTTTTASDGTLSISVPKDATSITITSRGGNTVVLPSTSTVAQINNALTNNNVVINGNLDASADATQIVVPAGRTLTVTGTLTLNTASGMLLDGTVTGGKMVLNGATVSNTKPGGVIWFTTMDWGSTIASGITITVTGNVTLTGDVTMNGKATVGGAIVVSTGTANNAYTISMTQAGASLTVEGGGVAGNIDAAAGTTGTIAGDVTGTISGDGNVQEDQGTVTPPEEDEYVVTVTVDGATVKTENVKKDGAFTYTYTADEGKLIKTASIGTIAADKKSVEIKIEKVTANTTIAITTEDDGSTEPEEPTTTITSVTVAGDKLGEYVFTINYANKAPDLTNAADKAAVIEKINEALADKTDVKVDDLLEISGTYYAVYGTDKAIVGSISEDMAGTFKVFVNGQEVDTITTADAAKGKTFSGLKLNTVPAGNLIEAGKGNVANGDTIEVTYSALSGQTSFAIAANTTVTADLYLVNAYELEAVTDLNVKSYTVSGGEKVAVANNSEVVGNFFTLGTSFELEGTKTTASNVTNLAFTVNGHEIKAVAAGTAKQTYTYTLSADELAASTTGGTAYTNFTLAEKATNVTTLKIGGKTFQTEDAVSGELNLKGVSTSNVPEAGEYIVVTKDGNDILLTNDATVKVTVTVSGSTVTAKVGALNSYTTPYTETGVNYVLVKAGENQLTISKDLNYVVTASGLTSGETAGSGEAAYFPAEGTITMLANDNIKDDYQVVKTVDSKETVIPKNAAGHYEYTIADEAASFSVQVLQVAKIRVDGPGKEGTDVNDFPYGEVYTSAGVSLKDNVFTVDTAKLVAFAKADEATEAYGNQTALYHLTQNSGELGGTEEDPVNGLFVGLAFGAPDSFSGAKEVTVTMNGTQIAEKLTLEEASVDGSGNDVLPNAFIKYLPFAKAPSEQADQITAGNMKIDDNSYEFVFTWLAEDGTTVLGTSVCTVSRVSK